MTNLTPSRREFIALMGTGCLYGADPARQVASPASLPHPPGGRLGLQLYSLRREMKADLPGTLARVRGWGFEDVEVAGTPPGLTAAQLAAELKKAGLRAPGVFDRYERLRDDMTAVVSDARALGVEYVICGWIPHKGPLTQADVDAAIASFNTWGAALRAQGLTLAYHLHGYEFVAAPTGGGTMLDALLRATNPVDVVYEMDVFWVTRGGGNAVDLLRRYPTRFRLMHLKDMAKGTPTGDSSGSAPDETNVPLGTGAIDYRAVIAAAVASGVKYFYLEDEHPNALLHIPQSLKYLESIR